MAELENKTIEDLMKIRRLEGDELNRTLSTIDQSSLGGHIDVSSGGHIPVIAVFRLGIGFPFVRPTYTPYTWDRLKGKSIEGYVISKSSGTFYHDKDDKVEFEAEKKLVIGSNELSLRYKLEIEYMKVGSIIIECSLKEYPPPKEGTIRLEDIYEGKVIISADGRGKYDSIASIHRELGTTDSDIRILFDNDGKYRDIEMRDFNDVKFRIGLLYDIVSRMRSHSIPNGEMVAVQVLGKIDPVYRAIDYPSTIKEMVRLFSDQKGDEVIGKLKDFEYFVFKDNN